MTMKQVLFRTRLKTKAPRWVFEISCLVATMLHLVGGWKLSHGDHIYHHTTTTCGTVRCGGHSEWSPAPGGREFNRFRDDRLIVVSHDFDSEVEQNKMYSLRFSFLLFHFGFCGV